MMKLARCRAPLAVALVLLLFAIPSLAAVDPTIMWKDCTGPADHPSVGKGNYYNLCIRGHTFENERHAWTFTKTNVIDSEFIGCTFAHTPEKKMDMTEASWTRVLFKDTTFSSFTNDPVVFERTKLEDVTFQGCTFDTTTDIVFSSFEFRNVTFIDCEFQSNARFELGQLNSVYFNNSNFRRSVGAKAVSGNDRIIFNGVTVRKTFFTDSDFITPVNFQAAQLADVHFNDTNFNEFWCHSVPLGSKPPASYAEFNDTIFYNVKFREQVNCASITWRGMHFESVRFMHNAIFARSRILNIVFDKVLAKPANRACRTLDFSESSLKRKLFVNVTASCKADFHDARIEQVYFRTFNAARPNFEGTIFKGQEYMDRRCCTAVCPSLGCKCDISEPSGQCPKASKKVRVGEDGSCFPGHATLRREGGSTVRMEDVQYSDRVAVGGGKHSDIFFFGHRDPAAATKFVAITSSREGDSEERSPLLISPGHYLYVNGRLATAGTVAVGDRLRSADNSDTLTVTDVSRVVLNGAYAPTTLHGDLVVEGVVVSSYTDALHPRTAHRLLQPLRMLYSTPLRGFVERASAVMRTRSFESTARFLRIPAGPSSVEDAQ